MSSTTVNFNLKTAGFANYANQTLTFKLLQVSADKTDDTVILPGIVTATSAANGTGSVALFTTGESDIESTFEVIFPNREKGLFQIPATSAGGSIHLSDLLVDHVPGGSAAPQNSIYDAAVAFSIQRANHTGTQALSTISDAATVQLKPSEGAFANGDKTKLNSIEASADVTDTTNVTDAGALMDSELADLTGVKTLLLPDSTTISTFAKTFLDDADAAAVKSTLGITDAVAISNFVPSSISFTNTSAYLSLADNAALDVDAGDFSLSFWARLDSSGTEPVLTKLSGTGYRLKFVSGSLILTMQDSGGSADFTLATGLNDSKWHVYVVTVDRSGNAIAYVDNVAQTGVGVSGTASTLANSGQFQIGSDGGSNAGDGIALGNYIALHKAILTASQASQIFFSADAALTAVAPTLMVDLRKATNTFTDVGTNGLAVTTNGTIIFNEGRLTEFTGTNLLATSTLGYTAGSGGTVTQATNKTTAVTLNKINGEIVMNGAALADDATAAFTLTNSTIAATDVVIVNVASVGTAGAYQVTVGAVAAGSCSISVLNVSGGALSEAIKLNFAVIKAVAS